MARARKRAIRASAIRRGGGDERGSLDGDGNKTKRLLDSEERARGEVNIRAAADVLQRVRQTVENDGLRRQQNNSGKPEVSPAESAKSERGLAAREEAALVEHARKNGLMLDNNEFEQRRDNFKQREGFADDDDVRKQLAMQLQSVEVIQPSPVRPHHPVPYSIPYCRGALDVIAVSVIVNLVLRLLFHHRIEFSGMVLGEPQEVVRCEHLHHLLVVLQQKLIASIKRNQAEQATMGRLDTVTRPPSISAIWNGDRELARSARR